MSSISIADALMQQCITNSIWCIALSWGLTVIMYDLRLNEAKSYFFCFSGNTRNKEIKDKQANDAAMLIGVVAWLTGVFSVVCMIAALALNANGINNAGDVNKQVYYAFGVVLGIIVSIILIMSAKYWACGCCRRYCS